jgi:hypothetical protein
MNWRSTVVETAAEVSIWPLLSAVRVTESEAAPTSSLTFWSSLSWVWSTTSGTMVSLKPEALTVIL